MNAAKYKIIEVLVADKSPLVQAGLIQIFENDDRFHLVATAADGERFMEAARTFSFDVAVIGWDMPYLNGREVLEKLREENITGKVVVYTGNQAPGVPRQVMQLGGAGFCLKSEPPERLTETIVTVADGRMVFPFMDVNAHDDDPMSRLTGREQEMLALLAKGRTNDQIADDMGISLNTVKFHLKNLYSKMQVSNRAQAVAQYLKAGHPS